MQSELDDPAIRRVTVQVHRFDWATAKDAVQSDRYEPPGVDTAGLFHQLRAMQWAGETDGQQSGRLTIRQIQRVITALDINEHSAIDAGDEDAAAEYARVGREFIERLADANEGEAIRDVIDYRNGEACGVTRAMVRG